MLPELLAPAGGPAAFRAALAAGADAIYCALGNDFNARRGADNFDEASFEEACKAAHIAGVRVYVTINIVIKESELKRALNHIYKAYHLGADAFIIQDLGLFAAVRTLWPEIECHISTQANIHDTRGVSFVAALGADRVTLSRELSLPEINEIAKVGCELEVFSHGALCFCYSGLCSLSALSGDRSANRGLCAQPCRLEYDLVTEDNRVLSKPGRVKPLCPKDACVYDDIEELIDAGAGALKIEGRMKAPEYVFNVIKSYRDRLDAYAQQREAQHEVNKRRLVRSFNRGFTSSYLRGKSDDDMMSYDRSNNRGEEVGVALSGKTLPSIKVKRGTSQGGRVRMRTLTQAEMVIELSSDVFKGDLLEVRPLTNPQKYQVGRVEEDASAGSVIRIITSAPCEAGSIVRLIRSQPAIDDYERSVSSEYVRKRLVQVSIRAHLGQPIVCTLSTLDGKTQATVEGFICEPARTKSITAEDLQVHIGRMGQSPFEAVSFDIELDDHVGCGFSALHKLRSRACAALEQDLLKRKPLQTSVEDLSIESLRQHISALSSVGKSQVTSADGDERLAAKKQDLTGSVLADEKHKRLFAGSNTSAVDVCVLVRNPNQESSARELGATAVYARVDDLLSYKGWSDDVIPWLDEVSREIDHRRLDPFIAPGKDVVVSNPSELLQGQVQGSYMEVAPTIPVHNSLTTALLQSQLAHRIWLSDELTGKEICELAQKTSLDLGVMVVGRRRAMTSEHCILKAADACIHDCKRCALRAQNTYLKASDGRRFPVYTDLHERSRLYDAQLCDLSPQIPVLLEAGIRSFLIDVTAISNKELAASLDQIKRALEGQKIKQLPGAVWGHFFEGIA